MGILSLYLLGAAVVHSFEIASHITQRGSVMEQEAREIVSCNIPATYLPLTPFDPGIVGDLQNLTHWLLISES